MKDFSKEFLDLLNGKFASLNLTRINDEEEFYQKQIVDSILPAEKFPEFDTALRKYKLHIDIGFGGGFPLLPLAKLYPDTTFLGFEARRKKADAVREIAHDLGLRNVKTFHQRIESVHLDLPCSVSFKAVGKINEFLKKLNPAAELEVFFFKGPNVHELEKVPEKLGSFRKILDVPYELQGTNGRTFISYLGQNVPRGTKKELVKVTELI